MEVLMAYINSSKSTDILFCNLDNPTEPSEDAIEFVCNPKNFPSFSEGLTDALKHSGFTGPFNIDSKTQYLYQKLQSIGSTIKKRTINDWFSGKHAPRYRSTDRINMYAICFALNFDRATTEYFFSNVYFTRCFDYHTINEAVYSYCIANGRSYKTAQKLINTIEKHPASKTCDNLPHKYTYFVKQKIINIHTDQELSSFLIEEKQNFQCTNQTALDTILDLRKKIKGDDSSSSTKIIHKLKKDISLNNEEIAKCGLLIQEIIFDSSNYSQKQDYIRQCINNANVFSDDFLLRQLLTAYNGIRSTHDNIPSIIKTNFPSKKVLSNLLKSVTTPTIKPSYDATRKILILLHYYVFWCSYKLRKSTNSLILADAPDSNDYEQEISDLLVDAGYFPLYNKNPYDWIFLYSAKQQPDPLNALKEILGDLCNND